MLSDKEIEVNYLVNLAKSGNANAYERLAKLYSNLIRSVSRKFFIIGGDSEDLVQEAMIGLHSAIVDFDEAKGNFSAFAKLCVTRSILVAVNAGHANKNKPLYNYIPLDDIDNNLLISQDPLESVILSQRLALVNEAINNLSKLEKQIYLLYNQGYSYDEISTILNLNNKTVDNALARAKKKIFKFVND